MIKIEGDRVGHAIFDYWLQNNLIEEMLNLMQRYNSIDTVIDYDAFNIQFLVNYQNNNKACYQTICNMLDEDICQDDEIEFVLEGKSLKFNSNRKRLEIVKEGMEKIILEVERNLLSRGVI